MADEACKVAVASTVTISTEAVAALLIVATLAIGIGYVRRQWTFWYRKMVHDAFTSVDLNGSGAVDKDELWAGVLFLYIGLRQQGIPADPPPRELVLELLDTVDTNADGVLNFAEFEEILSHLSAQTLGRAVTMIVFVALWPVAITALYTELTNIAKASNLGESLPSELLCLFAFIDDSRIAVSLLVVPGFVLIVPTLIDTVDKLAKKASLTIKPKREKKKSFVERMVKAVDPTPLLKATSGKVRSVAPAK